MEKIRTYFEQRSPLSDDAWTAIKNCFRREVFSKKSIVLEEGKVCRFVAFIESGRFQSSIPDPKPHTF